MLHGPHILYAPLSDGIHFPPKYSVHIGEGEIPGVGRRDTKCRQYGCCCMHGLLKGTKEPFAGVPHRRPPWLLNRHYVAFDPTVHMHILSAG